jgi:transposase
MELEQSETINELRRIIDNLNKTIDGLNQTIKELTEKLNKNSRNSSKPPSSDGLNKPSPKSLRKPSGKKPGGQVGHPGKHLSIKTEPKDIVRHMPGTCRECPNHIICESRSTIGETRQVIDASVDVKVTEHQSLVLDCPMNGIRQKGEFPSGIRATVQYGENLQALVVALNTIGAVSVNRTHEILSGIFNIPISTGTISAMAGNCADGLTLITEKIQQKLTLSGLINCDETGTRVDGKTMWVHTAGNSRYTHLFIHGKRGQEGIDAGMVLPQFRGITVHDCWMPYWKYQNATHALCNVHLLRELIGIEENHSEQNWATDFKNLLLEMKKAKENAIDGRKSRLTKNLLDDFTNRYKKIIAAAYAQNPFHEETVKRRGRKKNGKIRSLIQRLDKHRASVCLFLYNFSVPFDNNQAERDIRMIKTKTKVSGCFRSLVGAQNYLQIMSYVGTAKKFGFSAYEAIRQAISGNPNFLFTT